MERLYWTSPDIYEVEVDVEAVGDCRVTIRPIVFHPDEGGQQPDKGTIGEAEVLAVEIVDGQIVHTLDRSLDDGKYVARVDKQHRLQSARQHTAQHIISGIAEKRFGLKTVGVHIGQDSSTVDLDKKIDWQTAQAIERDSMAAVLENIDVETRFGDSDARSRFDLDDIDSGMIRVVKIGEYDASACCGTHVRRTGDIGIIRILDIESKKDGTRVSFVAGLKALEFSQVETSALRELRKLVKCSTVELPTLFKKAMDNAKSLSKEVERLQLSMLPDLVTSAEIIEVEGSRVGIQVDAVSGKLAAKLAGLIASQLGGTGIVVSEGTIAINSKSLNANDLLAKLKEEFGGKGGGSRQAASGKLDDTVTSRRIAQILRTN
ncbi:MAG: alanyl-tRNA editing protein [Planctomycetota bacterium]